MASSEHNADCTNKISALIVGYCGAPDDQESDVKDVLCDLMHFCFCTGMDFDAMVESARVSFEVEMEGI
jgi:hypothetical protein